MGDDVHSIVTPDGVAVVAEMDSRALVTHLNEAHRRNRRLSEENHRLQLREVHLMAELARSKLWERRGFFGRLFGKLANPDKTR